MPHFLECPNLPSGQVIAAAVGEDYAEEMKASLESFGIKVLTCPYNPNVDERLRSHIDLSVLHLGYNRFILTKTLTNSDFSTQLKQYGAEIFFSEEEQAPYYPNDASLCALLAGNYYFHNLKITNRRFLADKYKIVHVNQGYTKCAVCLINKSAAITADKGIIKAMSRVGIDILEINPSGILLKGFNEGFIGGTYFKISEDRIAFTGSLEHHPDKIAIENFLNKYNIEPVYLTNKPIFDIGSIIPILEI